MIYLIINFIFVTTGLYFLIFIASTMEPPVKPGFILVKSKKIEPIEKSPLWFRILLYPVIIVIYELAQIFPIVGWIALGLLAAGMLYVWADDLYLSWKER